MTNSTFFRHPSDSKLSTFQAPSLLFTKNDIADPLYDENDKSNLINHNFIDLEEEETESTRTKHTADGEIKTEEASSPDRSEFRETEQVIESFVVPEADGFALDFIQKSRTGDNIRRNYLSKLTYKKIWLTPLEKPKMHETAIIFDWDDTLLCTTFINPSGFQEKYDIKGPI